MPIVIDDWIDVGLVELGDTLDTATWEALTAEARASYGVARIDGFSNTASHRDGSFASPSLCARNPGGPVFGEILRSREILRAVRAATGLTRLIPVRCGFNFYRAGDYMGLHRDSVKASVTITFALTPGLSPMHWAPSLRRATNGELGELVKARTSFPDGFPEMPVDYRYMKAFDGYNIPHWRVPYEGELGILGTLCYFDL
jgi:hypothetical protein